jgi:hypothetical protein
MYLDAAIGGSCPNDNRTMPAGSTRAAGIYNDSSDGTDAPSEPYACFLIDYNTQVKGEYFLSK